VNTAIKTLIRGIIPEGTVDLAALFCDRPQSIYLSDQDKAIALKVKQEVEILIPGDPFITVYPVVISGISEKSNEITVEVSYRFNFAEIIRIIAQSGAVRRKDWPGYMDVKWISNDPRGFLWYCARNGYLSWFPSKEECMAEDYGVRYGYYRRKR